MAKFKKPKSPVQFVRTIEQITDAYQAKCAEAGQHQYRIKCLTLELNEMNRELAAAQMEYDLAVKEHKRKVELESDAAKALQAAKETKTEEHLSGSEAPKISAPVANELIGPPEERPSGTEGPTQ